MLHVIVLIGISTAAEVLRFYQAWLDDAAVKYGGKQVRDQRHDILRKSLILLTFVRPQIDGLSKEYVTFNLGTFALI